MVLPRSQALKPSAKMLGVALGVAPGVTPHVRAPVRALHPSLLIPR
jgi:hypothetical protein